MNNLWRIRQRICVVIFFSCQAAAKKSISPNSNHFSIISCWERTNISTFEEHLLVISVLFLVVFFEIKTNSTHLKMPGKFDCGKQIVEVIKIIFYLLVYQVDISSIFIIFYVTLLILIKHETDIRSLICTKCKVWKQINKAIFKYYSYCIFPEKLSLYFLTSWKC